MKLYCFPYAGGLSNIYYSWKKYLPPNQVILKPINIRPSSNKMLNTIPALVNCAYRQVKLDISEDDFAFFGHSMGGLIAYELARKLIIDDNIKPCHIFLSASRPPHLYKELRKTYDLPRNELIDVLRKMGGTPEAVLKNNELINFFLPIIRADFEAIETYEFKPGKADKIPVDFSILYGLKDNISLNEMLSWKDYNKLNCDFFSFNGDHFFVHSQINAIVNIITKKLEKHTKYNIE